MAPAWRNFKNIFFTVCNWLNRPVGAQILSGFQIEGKTDVWINQVRRVKETQDQRTLKNLKEPQGTPRNPEEPQETPRNPEEPQGTPRNSKEPQEPQGSVVGFAEALLHKSPQSFSQNCPHGEINNVCKTKIPLFWIIFA